MLPDASKFVIDFVEILTEVRNSVEFKNDIHGLLSDACTLDACCVTNDLLRRSLARLFVIDCCLLLSRTLPVSLSLKRTLVGWRRFRSKVAVVSGRRFRPNFGHLEFMYFWRQQPSEFSVEERTLLSSANKFLSC